MISQKYVTDISQVWFDSIKSQRCHSPPVKNISWLFCFTTNCCSAHHNKQYFFATHYDRNSVHSPSCTPFKVHGQKYLGSSHILWPTIASACYVTLKLNSYNKFLSSNICLLPLKSNVRIYVIDCRRFKSIVNQNINSLLFDKIQFE